MINETATDGGVMNTRHPGTITGRMTAAFLLVAVAGCGNPSQPTSVVPSEIALRGTATATSAAITAAGYSCATPTHNQGFTFELCQRPAPTGDLVPPDSMIRIYSRPDDSV